jgi:hypothetical protein
MTIVQQGSREEEQAVDDGLDGNLFFDYDITDLRAEEQKAFLGYMSMDVVDPPTGALWGKWNCRDLDPGFVNTLANDYMSRLDNCSEEHSMGIAVRQRWLQKGSDGKVPFWSYIKGKNIEEVPMITFNREGMEAIRGNELWVLEGNHRRLGLAKCIRNMEQELEDTKQKISEIKKGKYKAPKDDENGESESEASKEVAAPKALKAAEERVAYLEKMIKTTSHKWAIRLYDRGKRRAVLAMR